MSPRMCHILLCWLSVSSLVGCSSSPEPDLYPAGTTVTLKNWYVSPAPFVLGPQSSQLFLNMLAQQPVRSEIRNMDAMPMGTFIVDGKHYDWHGNGVIHVTGDEERLWHGPFTQRLINDVSGKDIDSRESLQAILDAIEQDSTVTNTPVKGPGQYPGGSNDALLQPAR